MSARSAKIRMGRERWPCGAALAAVAVAFVLAGATPCSAFEVASREKGGGVAIPRTCSIVSLEDGLVDVQSE